MLRVFPSVLLATLSLLVTIGSAWAEPDVLTAYRGARAAGLLSGLPYDVAADGAGGYVTTSPDWGTPVAVRIGEDGRDMVFSDEGTGGGNFELVGVVWEVAPGTELLITGATSYDGQNPGNTQVRIFSDSATGWEDVTDYTWPGVPLHAFLPDNLTIGDLRAVEAIRATIYIQLTPRDGWPVANFWVDPDLVRAVCTGEDWFRPADPAAYQRFCDRIAPHVIPLRALHWDPEYYQYRIDYSD